MVSDMFSVLSHEWTNGVLEWYFNFVGNIYLIVMAAIFNTVNMVLKIYLK